MRTILLFVAIVVTSTAAYRSARAAEAAPAVETAESAAATQGGEAAAAPLATIVRGLYVEMGVGGGYAVVGATIPTNSTNPLLAGESEGLGRGGLVSFAVGYDIAEMFAIEAHGGMTLVSSRRQEWVRDVAIAAGFATARLSFAAGERLRVNMRAGGGYARADNGVDVPEAGPAAFGGLGLEYYVHVRHFSVGLDLSVLAPLSPTRVFVSLAPLLKYTF